MAIVWEFTVWESFLTMLWFFLFFIWIWLLIAVFGDIFRSDDLSGWGKALWTIFVIVLPYLGVFIYLIARGKKMGEHAKRDAERHEQQMRSYVQDVAGGDQHRRRDREAGTAAGAGCHHRRRVPPGEGEAPGLTGSFRTARDREGRCSSTGTTTGPASAADGTTPDLDLVEYVVISVPELSSAVEVAAALKALVESAQIRILDLVGVATGPDGRFTAVEPELLSGLAALDSVEGEVGGLLSEDDITLASSALQRGTSALIVVVEDRWAQMLADAARQSGGRIIGGERIPRHRLEQSRRSRTAGPEGGGRT